MGSGEAMNSPHEQEGGTVTFPSDVQLLISAFSWAPPLAGLWGLTPKHHMDITLPHTSLCTETGDRILHRKNGSGSGQPLGQHEKMIRQAQLHLP